MIKRAPAKWPVILLLVVLTEAVNLTTAQEREKAGILRPIDQSVLDSEEVQIITRAGEIWLDGKSLKERQTQGTRQLFTLRIPAGRHELVWKNGDTLSEGSIHSHNVWERQWLRQVGKFTGRILLRQNVRTVTRVRKQEILRRSPLQRHASRVMSKRRSQRATPTTMKSWPSVCSATIRTVLQRSSI